MTTKDTRRRPRALARQAKDSKEHDGDTDKDSDAGAGPDSSWLLTSAVRVNYPCRIEGRSSMSTPISDQPHALLHFILSLSLLSTLAILTAGCGSSMTRHHSDPLFSFGVIADAQYGDKDTAGSRHYRESLAKLASAVDTLNQRDTAFVIQLGDLIEGVAEDPARSADELDRALAVYDRIDAPAFHVVGNHCFKAGRATLLRELRLERFYYDFTVPGAPGWRFVVLDGNDISLYAWPPDGPEHARAVAYYDAMGRTSPEWNGAVGPDQLAWLDDVLTAADDHHEKVILFCHFPVYPDNIHNLWNADEVRGVIESHGCVEAYLCGHNHAGSYALHDGIHYLAFKGMVEHDTNAFAVVEVYPDRLDVIGFGREPSRTLTLEGEPETDAIRAPAR